MRRTLWDNPLRWTFSFQKTDLVAGAFGKFDGLLRSQFSLFT